MPNKVEKRKYRSLTITLAIAFLILSLTILLISNGLQLYFNFQTQQQIAINQQNLIAQNAANTVKSFIQEKFSIMETTANLGNLMTAQSQEQKQVLDKLLGVEPSFRQLILLDKQKQEIEVSRLSQAASKLKDRLDNNLLNQIKDGKIHVGTIYVDDVTSEPMVIMTAPVKNIFGDFEGTLIAEVNLKFMWDLVDKIKIGNSGLSYVVDKSGNLIAFGDISRVLRGENLSSLAEVNEFMVGREPPNQIANISKGIKGTDVVSTFIPLGMPDWAVVVELPVDEAYAPIIQQLRFTVFVIILTIALALILGVYLSRRIANPIINLRNAAIKVGEGRLETKIDIETRDEIGQLAYAFRQMTYDLKKSRAKIINYSRNLEKKVDERTSELNKKVEELTESERAMTNMTEDLDETNKKLLDAQKQLKKSFSELKELDIEKDSFISIAAHELKTPMTAIHGFAQLLEDKKMIDDVETRKKYLKIIESEVERLSKLVTNVLDLSRIDLGTMKFAIENVGISKQMEEVKNEMTQRVEGKGLKLEFTVEKNLPVVRTDRERLREVLINLIDNSAKYTPKGGIRVKAHRKGNFIEFSVTDTGIGIPSKDFKKIFTRFYQVETPLTRKVGGTGLGLSICKELVENLGGKIWFKSKVGKGTTFFFTIPIESRVSEANKYQK